MIIDELIAVLGFDVKGEENLSRFNKALENTAKSAGELATKIGNAATLVGAALTVGFGALGKSVISTGATFESLRTQLTSLEGSAEKAEESLAWVKKFGQETPLSLTEAANAFAMMRNFGLDPTNGSLQAIVDNASLMNKGIDSVMGIILPLGQAWSAQKLQGQDMMQLINQGIPAWELLANSMGKTVAETRKLSEEGKIGRAEMTKFFEALAKRGAGASARMAKTWTGVMARMGDAWEDFNLRISEAGIFESAKSRAEELLALFQRWQNDGTMDRVAKKISNTMEAISDAVLVVIDRISTHIKFLNDNWDKLGGYINAAGIGMLLLVARANPVITAIGLLAIVVDDFITYLEGGESVIGDFIKRLQDMTGMSEMLAGRITALSGVLGAALFALGPKIFSMFIKGSLRFLLGPAGLTLLVADIVAAFFGVNLYEVGISWGKSLIDGISSAVESIASIIPNAIFGGGASENTKENYLVDGKKQSFTLPNWLTGMDSSLLSDNFKNNMSKMQSDRSPSTLNDSRDQSQTVNVNVGGVTVNGAQNVTTAAGAAVGNAVGKAAAGAASGTPSRIVNPGSSF